MLRKCWSPEDEADGVDVKVNCFINSSCCAEGRMKDIEVVEAKDETDQNDIEISEIAETKAETDNVDEYVITERGETVEEDILRSESPGRPSVRRCLGCCGANSEEKGAAVADETIDLHVAS